MGIKRVTITTLDEVNKFIRTLEDKYNDSRGKYFYRGQADSGFLLIPSAFRKSEIEKRSALFNKERSINELIFSDEAKRIVSHMFGGDEATRMTCAGKYMDDLAYRRIIEIIDFNNKYNFCVSQQVEKHRDKYDEKSVEHEGYRPSSYWLTDEAFYGALNYYMQELSVSISLDGKQVYKAPSLSNDFTPFDESLTQHYFHPTTQLDWTYNPLVALYFALPSRPHSENLMYFSVFVCERPEPKEGDPITFKEYADSINPNNERIHRQEGLLAEMRFPISFYHQKGYWPSMEAFLDFMHQEMHIVRYDISVTHIEHIRTLLNDRRVNQAYLLPEMEIESA